jgi:3-dehydroquinate dehydratase-1
MRPCVVPPMLMRDTEFGGPKPVFCIPLVAKDRSELLAQAQVAHDLRPDVVEWRADSYCDLSREEFIESARRLRLLLDRELIIFTLRIQAEGGKAEISQEVRASIINAVLRSGFVDLVDLEMCNGPEFLEQILATAQEHAVRVILSFHDFQATPSNDFLLAKISAMSHQGAHIAKIACMPREPGDVLRLFQVTLSARRIFPALPLCTMSMGSMGCLSRVAGFLYGSDMAFAVGQEVSAPGQIPISEARTMAESLLRYA